MAHVTERVKLDFYALGKTNLNTNVGNLFNLHSNKGISDKSNDLLTRNALSLNSSNLSDIRNGYRNLHTLNEANKSTNNYLNPIGAYNIEEKYSIPSNVVNKEAYNITRRKYFSSDIAGHDSKSGEKVSTKDFLTKKNNLPKISTDGQVSASSVLKENNLYFDKNNNQMIRYPKGFWNYNPQLKKNRTKISDEAPGWFHLVDENKQKKYEDHLIKNEETLFVFSRYQKWITVTPKNKNRKRPLEHTKNVKMEETSKIVPKWMQIKIEKEKLKEDNFKSAQYKSLKNGKNFTVLVDKNINGVNAKDNRSVFSIGDFRHNLNFKEEADVFQTKVSKLPKRLLAFDDGTVFNPKTKRDTLENKK